MCTMRPLLLWKQEGHEHLSPCSDAPMLHSPKELLTAAATPPEPGLAEASPKFPISELAPGHCVLSPRMMSLLSAGWLLGDGRPGP